MKVIEEKQSFSCGYVQQQAAHVLGECSGNQEDVQEASGGQCVGQKEFEQGIDHMREDHGRWQGSMTWKVRHDGFCARQFACLREGCVRAERGRPWFRPLGRTEPVAEKKPPSHSPQDGQTLPWPPEHP